MSRRLSDCALCVDGKEERVDRGCVEACERRPYRLVRSVRVMVDVMRRESRNGGCPFGRGGVQPSANHRHHATLGVLVKPDTRDGMWVPALIDVGPMFCSRLETKRGARLSW